MNDKQKSADRLMKWAFKSESIGRLRAMVELRQDEPGVPIVPTQLDASPWLLNCPNGTLDLRTGTLREHRREDTSHQTLPHGVPR